MTAVYAELGLLLAFMLIVGIGVLSDRRATKKSDGKPVKSPPSATQKREWSVGDRCRVDRFGESRNGTIVALVCGGSVAIVQRDGEYVERHTLTTRLTDAVDE